MSDEATPINRRRRRLAAGAAVLGAGALLAGPITAFAQQDDDDTDTETEVPGRAGGFISDVLDDLVTAGTLTQAQADAVVEALDAAKPDVPFGGGRGGPWGHGPGGLGVGRIGLEVAAEVLGIEEDALRDALREGTTLAELAEQNGVTAQAVIDALVAEATERITSLVNEGFPERPARTPDDETEQAPTTTVP